MNTSAPPAASSARRVFEKVIFVRESAVSRIIAHLRHANHCTLATRESVQKARHQAASAYQNAALWKRRNTTLEIHEAAFDPASIEAMVGILQCSWCKSGYDEQRRRRGRRSQALGVNVRARWLEAQSWRLPRSARDSTLFRNTL